MGLLSALKALKGKDLAGLAMAPGNIPAAAMLSHTTPVNRPVRDRISDTRINDAMKHEMHRQAQYVDGSYVDQAEPLIGMTHFNQPIDRETGITDILKGDVKKYASNRALTQTIDGKNYNINEISINPNADESFLFHELGHIANRQSGVGKTVADMRETIKNNPNLQTALVGAAVLAPGTLTALIPGDDDAAVAALAGAATIAPTILDEAFASNTALRMMETAGTRASLGQRGKLAGALLSYLAPAIGAAAVSGTVGNMLD